jgi:hypothetical protein
MLGHVFPDRRDVFDDVAVAVNDFLFCANAHEFFPYYFETITAFLSGCGLIPRTLRRRYYSWTS